MSRPKVRGNGQGTAYKRGSSWTACVVIGWRLPEDPSKPSIPIKRTKAGFATKKEALAYCPTLLAGGYAKPKQAPRLSEYWRIYSENAMLKIGRSKQDAYKVAWKKLKPLHDARIDTLSLDVMQETVSKVAHSHYTQKDCRTVLTKLFERGYAEGFAQKDLPLLIEVMPLNETEQIPFNKAEQKSLWKLYESGNLDACLPLLMIYTGMMPGELQYLKVEHIDLAKKTMYGMNLKHTGGNMMEDGRGHAVSDELVLDENNNNEANVRQKMLDYLGIDNYHITIDPQGDYIAHVDCWGKYLAPDKILIAKLPQSNSHYNDYEAVANYFATTNCCWGYPYKVYRVEEPGGNTVAPYTNSLILNKHVYVPLGSNSTYNERALEVYRDAMPGYEVVGVTNSNYSSGWLNTDALHCRTRGVMDFNMLFVDHRNVLFGTQECSDSIAVTSKFIAYSGKPLKQDSLLVYYSIDNGPYQTAHMRATGNPDEYVGYIKGYHQASEVDYYVFGADESGHRYQQPVFGELDPHHFTVNISFIRGDVNGDGNVNIADVTALINYLLSRDASAVNLDAADCDQSSQVSIDDVTALINYLLSGSWN